MFELKSTDDEGQILLFPIYKDRITVGRDPYNDIVLSDRDVSRWHALIAWDQDRLTISDQHSTNGVFVNNVRIYDPTALQVGDQSGVLQGHGELIGERSERSLVLGQVVRFRALGSHGQNPG